MLFVTLAFGLALPTANVNERISLPSSKMLLEPVPGRPTRTNSFPATLAVHPKGRYVAILNNGYGTLESRFQQSIAILDLKTNQVHDFPDPRFVVNAQQTYFLGLAFSSDGSRLYVSVGSFTDPTGSQNGNLGNGIAVYSFVAGAVSPLAFIKIPLQAVRAGKRYNPALPVVPPGMAIPYPAGLAVVRTSAGDNILVANNLSDNASLLDAATGKILREFDLSTGRHIPASYPYAVVVTRDGARAYCSLWNDSSIAELDLGTGTVQRRIPLLRPSSATAAGSHPTAMLMSNDEKRLYVALANSDKVAIVDTDTGRLSGVLSTLLPRQDYGGSYPTALAKSQDGSRLFVSTSGADAIAVFQLDGSNSIFQAQASGFIPTEWYPTAVAVIGNDLIIASGKGIGSGPNAGFMPDWVSDASTGTSPSSRKRERLHPYVVALMHGSIARLNIQQLESELPTLTAEVEESNLMQQREFPVPFVNGNNPIHHVIYIVKENRTYDQVLGDLGVGNSDPSLTMYGKEITPNQHALAKQFGVVDNFFCSGNVSGDGHVWSTAGISSDYTERTWQVMQRGEERPYDYEGDVDHDYPLREGIPDPDEPATGYIWTNVARHRLSHRNYAEYVESQWCDSSSHVTDAKENHPVVPAPVCSKKFIRPGDRLPDNVGTPHGSRSPWPWSIPILFRNIPTKAEIVGNFDLLFPDFRITYPDQLRTDEFLREFATFVAASKNSHGEQLPQFVIMRLPNDHTAGTTPEYPTPAALVADNDLAVGRVVDSISHSPYWDDTAIFILEDDAQDGPDHVDAHRSIAFVISKYSPSSMSRAFVDHTFYTTVSMIHTIEVLLGLPPMNNNDAHAAVMAPLFSGIGDQNAFNADYRNLTNKLIYATNRKDAPGAQESGKMDFSHADRANTQQLNRILWRDRMGSSPMPPVRHTVFAHND